MDTSTNSNSSRAIATRRFASIGVLASTAILLAQLTPAFAVAQHAQKPKSKATGEAPISDNDRIVHVLNRLGFGARPDDIDRVKQMGGAFSYIEQQLYPDKIDDSAVDQKLQAFPELLMSDQDIEAKYKDFIDTDQEAARLRREIRKMEAQKEAQAAAANPPASTTDMTTATSGVQTTPPAGGVTAPPAVPGANRAAVREMVAADPDLTKMVTDTRAQLVKYAEPIGLLHEEFSAAKLVRAVESRRQLQEVLVDFWSNHFNIDIRKAPCGVLKVLDDRNVIRPHILGKFRDLLEASAKSPAMLVYLDNFQSVSDTLPQPNPARRRRLAQFLGQNPAAGPNGVQKAPPKRKLGLNENYGREIMELHTLGVDGGYSQNDVHEVARCFTGWGIGYPDSTRTKANRYGEAGEFQFHPRVHDDGEKTVLGHLIPAGGGIQDGETVLDILASNPATMKHISYQLCQRLVCDEPPTSLINKCVSTWKRTDGDLREVVRTIVMSPEFFSKDAMRKKIKSPFEYAVSSVRALNGTLDPDALIVRRRVTQEANSLIRPPQGGAFLDVNSNSLLGQITTMGQPLFQYLAPTGFPEDSRKWVSSGALISRLNFSLALTQGKIKDVRVEDLAENAGGDSDPKVIIDRLSNRILHGEVSASTRATLLNEASSASSSTMSPPLSPATIAALLLGSPEFQRR